MISADFEKDMLQVSSKKVFYFIFKTNGRGMRDEKQYKKYLPKVSHKQKTQRLRNGAYFNLSFRMEEI